MLSTMVPVEYIKSYSNTLDLHRHTYIYYEYVYTHALNVHRHLHICEYKDMYIYRACPRTSCPTLLGLRNERAVLGPDCSAPDHIYIYSHCLSVSLCLYIYIIYVYIYISSIYIHILYIYIYSDSCNARTWSYTARPSFCKPATRNSEKSVPEFTYHTRVTI
jgi:hypothetical protein